MAEIDFTCPRCGRAYQVDEGLAGKKARCKECKEIMRIPVPSPRVTTPKRLEFACPRCDHQFSLDHQFAGRKARCKSCGEILRVPEVQSFTPPTARSVIPTPDLHRLGPSSALEANSTGYDLAEPNDEPTPIPSRLQPSERKPFAARAEHTPSQPRRGGFAPPPLAASQNETFSTTLRGWLVYRAKTLALGMVLLLLLWAFSALLPRAWRAGNVLVGTDTTSPNDRPTFHSESDPDLDFPDVAADRLAIVLKQKDTLGELAQDFNMMAQGYHQAREPGRLADGMRVVIQGTSQLDATSKKGEKLPPLESNEKALLSPYVDKTVRPAVAGALQQLAQLTTTPELKENLEKMRTALMKTASQLDREFPAAFGRPSVLLLLDKDVNSNQQQLINEKVSKLVDTPGESGLGWRTQPGEFTLKVSPVFSARAFADRIDFGKVKRIQGRRIELELQLPANLAEMKAQTDSKPHEKQLGAAISQERDQGERKLVRASPPTESAAGASIVAFRWVDESDDRIGGMDGVGRPDGTKDQHLVVEFEFPEATQLEGLSLTSGGNRRWVTQPSDLHWLLAVYHGTDAVAESYRPRLGDFSGRQTFDLYGNTPGNDAGTEFQIEAEIKVNGQAHTLTSRCKRP